MKSDSAGSGVVLNDVHSGLNPTRVAELVEPASVGEVVEAVRAASAEGRPVAVSGGRHAMGGQQFVDGGVVLDLRRCSRVLEFNRDRGLLRAEAGIEWPALIESYLAAQSDGASEWGIAQKQTGADTLTLGGSLAANAHGRGLTMRPMIADVEAFSLVRANGELVRCSRTENAELFSLAIGGYGLFGVIVDVTLRLVPRRRLERVVEVVDVAGLDARFEGRIAEGCLYGDFQFAIDETADTFLQRGVFSCYRPTERAASDAVPRHLAEAGWLGLLQLAYTDRARVFDEYAGYYRSTNGQVYWSDTHQLSPYLPDYAGRIPALSGAAVPSSLVITEVYVPLTALAGFLRDAAAELRRRGVIVIYGTVRLIERDGESFLAWAKERSACVIFNLLVEHSPAGRERAAGAFRALIDLAAGLGGRYYLTYHRHATAEQIRRCYPEIDEFFALQSRHDPGELWQSEWSRHTRGILAGGSEGA